VRACVRASVRASVRACVRVCVSACVRACAEAFAWRSCSRSRLPHRIAKASRFLVYHAEQARGGHGSAASAAAPAPLIPVTKRDRAAVAVTPRAAVKVAIAAKPKACKSKAPAAPMGAPKAARKRRDAPPAASSVQPCALWDVAGHRAFLACYDVCGSELSTVALPARFATCYNTALLQQLRPLASSLLRSTLRAGGASELADKLFDIKGVPKASALVKELVSLQLFGSASSARRERALLAESQLRQWQAEQADEASDGARREREEAAAAVADLRQEQLRVQARKLTPQSLVCVLSAVQATWT